MDQYLQRFKNGDVIIDNENDGRGMRHLGTCQLVANCVFCKSTLSETLFIERKSTEFSHECLPGYIMPLLKPFPGGAQNDWDSKPKDSIRSPGFVMRVTIAGKLFPDGKEIYWALVDLSP